MSNKLNNSFILCFFILLMLISFSGYLQDEKSSLSIKKLLITELQKHPNSKVNDIYKFLHQAAFGSEHAVKDTVEVRKWMEQEIANLDYSINDELIDNLSPDGRLVRINLRPYLKKGFDSKLLLEAFIKTANNYRGTVEKFKSYWKYAVEISDSKKYLFTREEMINYFEEQSKKNYPAVHHSKEYEKEYKPAYRVVDLKYLQFLIK